ncbi:SDR family oxidoreductase [Mycobacterium ostraviense]|uniref:Short-chain dehydrogenase n=1 Tax=Mycobacterium ostraviense TaxID=2738409 RepID=A0A164F2G7_9MYCO|nr:SDR family oxidoreductase [Mycobacterium ostraviense]KZS68247.1 short-chain dehydrogenase [Mycobacterium ostraviense]UGT90137.1 SDR family oxidoreductase [Mycobacterium ostraviense]
MKAITTYLSPELLSGTSAFITGGGSGVNLGIARCFAQVGADIAICGRTPERLEAAAEELGELGATVSISVADVRDMDAMSAAFIKARNDIGPISTVVCGAAGNFLAPAETMSSNGFRTVIDIDLLGSFHAAHAAFDQLKETRGSLLFISAGQSDAPYLYQAHVGAAKAAIDSLVRHLALEWGPHGIRSNTIVPGPIEGTEGMKRLAAQVGRQAWTDGIALGRFGTAEEVGAMAVVLASPLASFVTGARIVVDGGLALSGSGIFNHALAVASADRTPAGDR